MGHAAASIAIASIAFAFVALAGGQSATTVAAQPGGSPSLSVMSFNVRYATERDQANRWLVRRELVVDTIRRADPDLLGTQEVLATQAEFLRRSLPSYAFHGVGRDDGLEQGEFVAVFFRRERFELLDSGHFWLSKEPDRPGSKDWDAAITRIASWVRLRDLEAGQTLLFLNTHWDHRGRESRTESARVVAQFIEQRRRSAAVIVTGDFNCDASSEGYRILAGDPPQGAGLIDSYRKVHAEPRDDEATFNGFKGRTRGRRIDWILHSPQFATRQAAIVRDHVEDRYPSDHYPVTATLEWHGLATP